jgi:hypothetical protein
MFGSLRRRRALLLGTIPWRGGKPMKVIVSGSRLTAGALGRRWAVVTFPEVGGFFGAWSLDQDSRGSNCMRVAGVERLDGPLFCAAHLGGLTP